MSNKNAFSHFHRSFAQSATMHSSIQKTIFQQQGLCFDEVKHDFLCVRGLNELLCGVRGRRAAAVRRSLSVLGHVCYQWPSGNAVSWQQCEPRPNGKSVSQRNRCPREEIRCRERLGCLNRKWKLMCSTSIYLPLCPSGGCRVYPEDNMETKSCLCLVHKTLWCVCSSLFAPL